MRDALFHLNRDGQSTIQSQLRRMLVSAILDGQIPSGEPLPSSRRMAKRLGVSRNTVSLVYQGLVDDGYLTARERSGFFVNEDIREHRLRAGRDARGREHDAPVNAPRWSARFKARPSLIETFQRPPDWQDYPYPFIYGQVDKDLFPITEWRECSRQALGRKGLDVWTADAYQSDDPMLVEQVRTHLLPRRGILADDDEILVTLGAQNAIYLLASLLARKDTVVGFEEPGYQSGRAVFELKTPHVRPIPVDEQGMVVDERLDDCDYAFVTPSHHYPTTVTMTLARRRALMERAAEHDVVVIEDDYEPETNYVAEPTPALKSLDTDGRVIYIGSLSKSLFPGLRLGYLVGSRALVHELRALRRLMLYHPPNNNQRTAALFIALGYHDALIHRLHKAYHERWTAMGAALEEHLPNMSEAPSFGGTSYWVQGPPDLDADRLAAAAREHGVIIEPGRVTYASRNPPRNVFRLAFSSIATERIEPGIEILAGLIRDGAGRR